MRAGFRMYRRRLAAVALVSTASAAAVALRAGISTPPCPFRFITGLDCPGCGSTRACIALLDGDVLAALDHNALIFPTLAVAAYATGSLAMGRSAAIAVPYAARIALIGVLGFWAARLVPFDPFTYLASSRY